MPATALNGTLVLDFGHEPTALTGRILADLGARVVLVEREGGSSLRRCAPFVEDAAGPDSSYRHLYLNANKQSVVVDWESEAGRRQLQDLVSAADVLIESGEPGEMEGAGLGFAALSALNPALIYLSASPYGPVGPRAGWRGTDLTAQAAAGLLQISGEMEDPPARGPASPAYAMTSLAGAAAVMIALHGRDAGGDGKGVHIHISMQEATMSALVQTSNPNIYLARGEVPERPALSQAMLCADGKWMAANILGNRIAGFIEILNDLNIEHSLTQDNWTQMHSRHGAWRFFENPMQYLAIEAAKRLPRDEFLKRLWEAGSAAMPVYDFPQMAESEHYRVAEQFRDVAHPRCHKTFSFPRSPVDAVSPRIEIEPAPALGQHTDTVLGDIKHRAPAPTPPTPREMPWMPLHGIKVVDFCWVAAGPLGTRVLANFGADVLKIESSARIDSLRNQQLPDGTYHHDLPDLFNDANTGKRSVAIDLTTDAGKAIAKRLIDQADVVVDNYTAGALARMGFHYEELRKTNPGLVMLHLPGFGGESPWRDKRSLGNLLMAASGLNYLTGFPGRPPRGIGIAYPDFTTPFLTVTTVLACLRERARTGLGREMELSQLSASVALLGAEWMQYADTGIQPERPGNRDPNLCPHGVYPAAGPDRWVAIAVRGDTEWAALARAIGRSELIDDVRFSSHGARTQNEDAVDAIIASWTRHRDRWGIAEHLQAAGIAASAVEDLRDLMDADPHTRGHFQRVFQPSAPDFEIAIDAEPIRFAGEDRRLRRAPMLGEHTQEVMSTELGMSDDEFAEHIASGVLR